MGSSHRVNNFRAQPLNFRVITFVFSSGGDGSGQRAFERDFRLFAQSPPLHVNFRGAQKIELAGERAIVCFSVVKGD
jgi:hypothetical protein